MVIVKLTNVSVLNGNRLRPRQNYTCVVWAHDGITRDSDDDEIYTTAVHKYARKIQISNETRIKSIQRKW